MATQTLFPTRQGLSLPRGENLQSVEIFSEGGLDLTQGILETRPGFASLLINFEPALIGGYRRISGFSKFSTTAVTGTGQLLGVAVHPIGQIMAARQNSGAPTRYDMYYGTGTVWTSANGATNLTYASGMVVQSYPYNWTGTYTMAFADGVNPAYTWNGSAFVLLNGAGSAANPQFVAEFAGYLIVAGYSSNYGAIKISAPLNAADWATVDGAAEIVIGDTITGIRPWREQLIIFCKNSIYRMIGTSTNATSAQPFTIQQITDRVGCVEGRTIREINGDLIFLAQDGLRTIAGTAKIGDSDIGSISRPIQSIVSAINPTTNPCHSVVIRKKTQYRLFYPNSSDTDAGAKGVIAAIRRFRDGHEDWEFSETRGIKPACSDSGYWVTDSNEYVIHGGYDGFVYRQEQGGSFNGTSIGEIYKTVPLEFGDRGIRKVLHRATLYISIETGVPTLQLNVIYDLNKSGVIQPQTITLTNLGGGGGALYDSSTYDSTAVWDSLGAPSFRQNLTGSGFLSQLQFTSSASSSYIVQGFLLEYFPAGRR